MTCHPCFQQKIKAIVNWNWRCFPCARDLSTVDRHIIVIFSKVGFTSLVVFILACSQRWDNSLRCSLLFGFMNHFVLFKDVNISFFHPPLKKKSWWVSIILWQPFAIQVLEMVVEWYVMNAHLSFRILGMVGFDCKRLIYDVLSLSS